MHSRWLLAVLLPRLLSVSMTLAFVACNTRTPLLDSPALTTAPTPTTAPPSPPSALTIVDLVPGGTIGGGAGRGTVFFDAPVPAGGTAVSLSTSNPIVAVTPSQLMVPGGSLSADFSYATQPVAADTSVEIVASTSDRSRSKPLAVWAVVPMFASYSSERGMPLGNGTIGRFTPGNAIFEAGCYASIVSARVTRFDPHDDDGFGSEFGFGFGAPPGVPLRPGVYENTSDNERAGNFMALLVAPSATVTPPCRLIGRFTVHDVAVTGDGQVVRLWATFEASCAGRAGTIRGDVRLTNPTGSSGIPCTR